MKMKKENNVIELKTKFKNKSSSNFYDEVTSYNLLEKTSIELTTRALLSALKCKDDYTWGHSLRVAFYCITVGKEMNLTPDELYTLELSALFHDLGKIGVPDAVLKKPSRLTEEEFLEMKLHPSKSFEILKPFTLMNEIAKNAKHHHERFDGRGYPDNLKGEDIPLFSRLILIADTFDAMTSTRPYRKGLPFEVAFQELTEFSGTQFDPALVKHFISAIKKESEKSDKTFTLNLIEGNFAKEAA